MTPTGERVSLAQLTNIEESEGASEIYREGNQRYIAVKYSVRERDLGNAVEKAMRKVDQQVNLPRGYHIDWEGEYKSEKRAEERLLIIVPLSILLIVLILYTMFRVPQVGPADPGQLDAGEHRRSGCCSRIPTSECPRGVGFLALFGVSVQTGVIMLEYINQLRARGNSVEDSAVEGAVLRLRPIMMTMLVATLGLLLAALSHGIGSDSQRPFAIVIVGGLISDLPISISLLPTLYVWMAGPKDVLPKVEWDEV